MKSKIFSAIFLGLFLFLFTGAFPAWAETENVENKIKKIVMMLNIVSKEFQEGISEGKVINAAEYEESQVFLEQAFNRYQKLAKGTPLGDSGAQIAQDFMKLTEQIQRKVEPRAVRAAVSDINTALLEAYGVEISITPTTAVNLENGKNIYLSNCSVCHGMAGQGDGPLASTLDPAPAVLADPEITGDDNTVGYDNFQVISVGIANTGMVGWAGFLSEPEIWDVTYFIRTFSNANAQIPMVAATTGGGPSGAGSAAQNAKIALDEIRGFLAESLKAFKENQIDSAADLAFDAYLAYEKIESGLINKRKELGLRLESSFSRYRGEIKRGAPLDLVEKLFGEINDDLSQAQEVLQEEIGFAGLFIQSFSIIVREGFEAILIIAALIAFLRKSRNQDKLKTIYMGVAAGILGSFITAYVMQEFLHLSMASQEIMEGWVMLIAVAVLFWVSYWLVSKIETQKWQSYITNKMRDAVSKGSAFTLGAVAFLSVYREGFETVLFYKALYLYAGSGTGGILPGFFAGGVCLGVVYYLLNQLGIRIPIKWFFAFTSVFLYYMAFTFMGKGLHELQMGEQLSMTPAAFLPEIPWMGMYPTWETFIGQAVLAVAYVFALVYTFGIKPEVESKHLKEETSNLQKDISFVHDLVEHISGHAKRCEIFLKDTGDQDLKELSEHLKEIDVKVHELADHVQYVENQLLDEYDKLGREAFNPQKAKGLS